MMMMMIVEKSAELFTGKIEILGENVPQCDFIHHKTHMS
jgi:hypothetical protein